MKILNFLSDKKTKKTSGKVSPNYHGQMTHRTSLIDGSDGWDERRKANKKRFEKAMKEKNKINKEKTQFSIHFLAFKDIKPAIVLCTLMLVIGTVVVQSFNWTAGLLQQPVLSVDVQGEFKYLEKSVIATIVNESLESGYLQTDLPSLHAQLVARPWIKEASLKRKLNSALQIDLKEHIPLAIWNIKTLISTDALLFTPEKIPADLLVPMLSGRDYVDVLSMYELLAEQLPLALLPIRSLDVAFNGGITIESQAGVKIILTREDWKEQLQRFVVISDQALTKRFADVKSIDMRYTNGAAVSWREHRIAHLSQ